MVFLKKSKSINGEKYSIRSDDVRNHVCINRFAMVSLKSSNYAIIQVYSITPFKGNRPMGYNQKKPTTWLYNPNFLPPLPQSKHWEWGRKYYIIIPGSNAFHSIGGVPCP